MPSLGTGVLSESPDGHESAAMPPPPIRTDSFTSWGKEAALSPSQRPPVGASLAGIMPSELPSDVPESDHRVDNNDEVTDEPVGVVTDASRGIEEADVDLVKSVGELSPATIVGQDDCECAPKNDDSDAIDNGQRRCDESEILDGVRQGNTH